MFLGVFFTSETVVAGATGAAGVGAAAGAGGVEGLGDVLTVSTGAGGQEVNTKHSARRQKRTFAFML
jgi:hypothetical protein